jgi:cell division protease FtsH
MENKPTNKGVKPPQFNIYWVYALILLGIIGFSLMGDRQTVKKATITELETYIKEGKVESLVVQKRKDIVEAYIKDSARTEIFGKGKVTVKPKVVVTIPSAENFDSFVREMQDKYGYNGSVDYQENRDYFISFLINILPLVILFGLWIYFMRRMSAGAGGGSGGGVFSVGKSKAQLFDKGSGNRLPSEM